MRRIGLLCLLVLLLAACGQPSAATSPTSAPAASAPAAAAATSAPASVATSAPAASSGDDLVVDSSKLAKELHIFNWADYIDPSVLTDFQKEYGVKVTMDVFDNNEDMVAKISSGSSGYDVAFPSDYAVDIMTRGKLVAPLDKSLLPNMKHLNPQNMNLYYDKGNVVSIPYNLGLTGLAYDKTKVSAPIDSWASVFDQTNLAKIKGQVSMLDDERETPGAALHFLGKSMNATDTPDLQKAEDLLKAQKPFLASYDSSNVSRRLASGEIVIGHIFSYNALQARLGIEGTFGGNPNIEFVVPKEGGTIWQDNVVVIADSPNQYTAHVFINYLMRPAVAAKNAAFILGVTPNKDANTLLPQALQDAYKQGFAPDDAMLKRLEWTERNDKTKVFSDLWTAVKGQ